MAGRTETQDDDVMETRSAVVHRKMLASPRQLPITGFAHKTTIEADEGMAAAQVLTARDMPAERSRATALDGTHHLQLAETDLAAIGGTPSGTVIAEDIRDLQIRAGHGPSATRTAASSWLGAGA